MSLPDTDKIYAILKENEELKKQLAEAKSEIERLKKSLNGYIEGESYNNC